MGIIAKREGDEAKAEDYFRQAFSLNPANRKAQRELSFISQHKKQEGIVTRLFSR